ncbi:MAG TPA: hypothetical protein VIU61_30485 [Kofleriaceae bacterium]
MGDAYTPGLAVTRAATVRKTRRLPLVGKVLVEVGARVTADQVVARTELPGKVTLVNLATQLGVLPDELAPTMVVRDGAAIAKGDPLARRKTWFGWSETVIASPITGSFDSVSTVTGMAILSEPPIPVEVRAYVDGTVVEVMANEGVVVETRGALVQGIFGLGGERQAPIAIVGTDPAQLLDAAQLDESHRGKVVIGGGRVTLGALRRAAELGVAAIVSGGFAYQDVRELLGYDVGVAITGNEEIATTLVVTEGFGDIAMARTTFELLGSLAGRLASVNGATQIRAGVIRPEIVVPDPDAALAASTATGGLELGAPVRCIRAPYFGRIGTVSALPIELVSLPSETKVRVLEVDLGTERVTVPRANVEVIER